MLLQRLRSFLWGWCRMNKDDPVEFAEKFLGAKLLPWQRQALTEKQIVKSIKQTGKTKATMVYMEWLCKIRSQGLI